MKPFVKETLDRQQWRLEELDALLSAPDVVNDMARFRQLSREHAELSELGALYKQFQQRNLDLTEAQSLLKDPEMADMAAEEITACEADLLRLDEARQALLLPKDPDDERNAYLEIRAGTGGDEASLFAAELYRAYTRYAEGRGWKIQPMSSSAASLFHTEDSILGVIPAYAGIYTENWNKIPGQTQNDRNLTNF